MQDFCNSVGIMEQGSMVVAGRIDDVLAQVRPGRTMKVELADPNLRLLEYLVSQPLVSDVSGDASSVSFNLDGGRAEAAALLRELVRADFALADFAEQEGSLQDIFAEVSSGSVS